MERKRTHPRCIECGKVTERIHPIMDLPVCPACQRNNKEKYGFVTKSRALGEYRLRPPDLRRLQVYEVDNPYYKKAAPMQLYLHSQVREMAAAKWGSPEPYIVTLVEFPSSGPPVSPAPSPTEPYIVTLEEFPDALLEWFLEDTERLKQLEPGKFQRLIADRVERMGLAVQMVGDVFAKDGGIDLIAYPRPSACAFPFLLAVQVKHHRTARKTGSSEVRDFHGVLASRGSSFQMGMIVTNTSFTADAAWFASNNQTLIRLRDIRDLRRWLQDDFVNESESREVPDEVELAPGIRVAVPKPRLL